FAQTAAVLASQPPARNDPPVAVEAIPYTPKVPPTAVYQYANGDAATRDKRSRDLEEKIRGLLRELHELRGDTKPTPPIAVPAVVPPTMLAPPPMAPAVGGTYYYQPVTSYREGKPVTSYQLVTTVE